ncbi:MAG: Gx transporter family protein [Ruminococcus sp.]|jgi:heptaprenyl diphosphate synthase|nr:Gx transporter family protein [Ruminococcus sp.]
MMRLFNDTKKITLTAILLAVTIVLSWAETVMLPNLPTGVRLGLSNITIMTAVILLGGKTGFALTALKSGFVLLTRGVIAGAMSFAGGIFALVVIIILLKKTDSSFIFVSVTAAISHIIGQLILSAIITKSVYVFAYAPLLLIAGILSGILTGVILGAVVKAMEKLKKQS